MLIDLNSSAMQHDPYPMYAEMRRQTTPVMVAGASTNQGSYILTRYADVMSVLKDGRFVNDGRKVPGGNEWMNKWYVPKLMKAFADTMALVDEPDHTRLRRLVHKAFTPASIQQMNGKIQEIADELLDAAGGKPVVDFIDAYALPLPLRVIGDMMGISEGDRQKFRGWMSNSILNASPKDPLGAVPKLFNAFRLNGFITQLATDRRQNPQDDLTSALVQAEEAGDKLSEPELIAMLFLMLFAGHETTVSLLGAGTLALLQHPAEFEKLKANPDLLEGAIEELLRFTSPTQFIARRYAMENIDLNGIHIPKYTPVILIVAAANRDETVFPNPDVLDITRSPNKHLAFGFGVHHCLGLPLARIEAKIAFGKLIQRFPDMQLAVPADQLQWRGAPALRGLDQLPIRLNG